MALTVLVPNTHPFDGTMPEGARAVEYDINAPVPEEYRDAEMLVLWENPRDRIAELAQTLPDLKLVQTMSAGPDNALGGGFAENVAIASGRGLHDVTVAEHVLTLALVAVRRIPDLVRAFDDGVWRSDLGGTAQINAAGPGTLHGQRVTIWGFGSIASHVAPMLAALGAKVRGLGVTNEEVNGFQVTNVEDRLSVLAETDILIMILPGLPSTQNALSTAELDALPDTATVINCGRGMCVDEPALIEALEGGKIAQALLDVTVVEPLPAGDPLWKAPNLFITPHAAGGRPIGGSALIARQAKAILDGTEFRNRVR